MSSRTRVVIDDKELKRLMSALSAQGDVVRLVADGVEYGIYQELGTSKAPAQPFMTPAVEAMRPRFAKALQQTKDLAQVELVVDKVAHDVAARAKSLVPVDTGMLKNSIHVVSGETFETSFTKLSGGQKVKT